VDKKLLTLRQKKRKLFLIEKMRCKMAKKRKFNPGITRIRLNPEQAVLFCECYDTGYRIATAPFQGAVSACGGDAFAPKGGRSSTYNWVGGSAAS
jgi:hypothetical protein